MAAAADLDALLREDGLRLAVNGSELTTHNS
jgi:hypothetical protein